LSVGQLVESIKIATSDDEMKARASLLGEKIREEDGITRAVEIIESLIV
jgi:sterol 3beta-glucosyltransferase